MRLGPLEIRRSVKAAAPGQIVGQERGTSGTINVSGYLQVEEYLPELQWPQSLRVFDRMRRGDAAVREALFHIYAPILNAHVDVEACSQEPEDLEVAAAVRAAYFDWAEQPFTQHLRQALQHLAMGFSLFECPLGVLVDEEVTYEDPKTGEDVTVPARPYRTWRRFAQRLPRTIIRWNQDPESQELESITQQSIRDGNYSEVDLPADQVLLFVNEQEGDDYTGLSLLRSAYKAWWLKETAEKVQAVSIERYGVGTPTAYPPESAQDADLNRMELILQNLRSGEQSYIVMPGPKAQASEKAFDGWTLEILSPAGGVPDFTPWLEYLRGDIKGNVLARFSELGHGSVGARATGDSQSPIWTDALHAVATYFCDVHNTQLIPRFVTANFPGIRSYPKLVVSDIESKNLAEFANAHAKLVLARAIVPDPSYRAYVREVMESPPEDDPEAAERETQDPTDEVNGIEDEPETDGPVEEEE